MQIVQKVGWKSWPVWGGAEYFVLSGIWSPDHPVRSESLYRLRCHGPCLILCVLFNDTINCYGYIYLWRQWLGRQRLWNSAVCWGCGFEYRWRHGCLCLVSVVCCQIQVFATGWSFVQKSPTECGVSECHRESSTTRRPWHNGGCCAVGYTNIESVMNKMSVEHWRNVHLKLWKRNFFQCTLSTTNTTHTGLVLKPGFRGEMPATSQPTSDLTLKVIKNICFMNCERPLRLPVCLS